MSAIAVTAVGLTCKAAIALDICPCIVNGLPKLLQALDSDGRSSGQGVLTIANHISTLDDPLMWGILPVGHYLSPRTVRWALGASDIVFTNPVLSAFFRSGHVLETFRGRGIYQEAVDVAIQKLDQGDWVHLFPESKVCQPNTYAVKDGIAHLSRFKWGFGRMLMEAKRMPTVIPIWLTGFDRLMPEGRPFPLKFVPLLGTPLTITIGDPIPSEEFRSVMGSTPSLSDPRTLARSGDPEYWEEMARIRSAVTAIAQRAVEDLGRSVSGPSLGREQR